MKRKVYLLIFDGLADWEPAPALCAITRADQHQVVTVGFTEEPVTTMGGLRVIPDITLDKVNMAEADLFILPGGTMWEQGPNEQIIDLLHELHAAAVPVAAICGATLEVARAGLTTNVRHTSNAKEYLQMVLPDYEDKGYYVDALAISDQGIITASGLGNIEFGREIIQQLHLYSAEETQVWFDMFKHGIYPAVPA